MACVMVCAYGGTGHYLVKDNVTNGNVRADHTIMVRVKWTVTTNNEDYYAATLLTSAGTSGSFVGRLGTQDGGGAATTTRGGRRSTTPAYNTDSSTGSYGDTTTWRHLAMTYNASTQVCEYFIDGVSQGTVSSTTSFVGTDTAGAFGILGKGKFADLALYSRVLTNAEILQMASYRVLSVTSNCLGFYRMDTNSSGGTAEGNATDTSGNGNTLVATTSAGGTGFTYSTADNPPQPENPELVGTGSSASTLTGTLNTLKPMAATPSSASTLTGAFTQTQPLASTASSASTLTGALNTLKPVASTSTSASSLAAWIRPRWGRRITDLGGTAALTRSSSISKAGEWTIMAWIRTITVGTIRVGFTSNGVTIGSNASGQLNIRLFDDSTVDVMNYTASDDGQWHHLAIVCNGSGLTARAYLDGTQVDTATPTLSGSFNPIALLSQNSGVADVAQLKVWTTALQPSEVATEMAYNTPHAANSFLYAWYQLAWNDITTDGSGNSRTLTDNGSTEAQSESPGIPLTLMTSTLSSASTLTGAIIQSQPLAATASSASTFTADLGATKDIAATATSASTLTALLGQAQPIAGSATSASTLTGAVVQNFAIAGSATSASTLSALLGQAQPIAGTATSADTLTGALAQTQPVAGTLSSASTLTGAVVQAQALASTASSASTLTGLLTVPGAFVGVATSASTLTADLGLEQAVAGMLATASTLTGQMEALLTGTAASASTLTGNLELPADMAGTAASASSLSGALTGELAAVAQSASTLAGQLMALLSSTATSASTLTGALSVTKELAGTMTDTSYFNATLSGGTPVAGSGGRAGEQNYMRRQASLQALRRRVR